MKILLVQTSFLGDVILSTPVIASLRRIYPEAEISVLLTKQAASLLQSDQHLSQVIIYDKRGRDAGWSGLRRMSLRLQKEQFTMAFSLHKSWRTALLLRLADIPQRYGFCEASASWLYTHLAARSDLPHEVLRNLALLRSVGWQPEELAQALYLDIPQQALIEADKLLSGGKTLSGAPLVGMAPGSAWATKRWTTEGFALTAKELQQSGCQVVLIGGNSDTVLGEEICRKAGISLLNLIGKTSLITSAAVISKLSLLISNDSSPMHIAAACKVPVVGIFCATVPEFGFGPWMVRHRIAGLSCLSCRPCARHGGKRCPTGTSACQQQLSAAAVLDAAFQLLRGT